MTPRQAAIIDFIGKFRDTYGVSPTVREMAHSFGLAGPGSLQPQLDAMVRDGLLNRPSIPGRPGQALPRGLTVTKAAMKARTESL